jgi:LacI family transcriptional regulator
MADVARHAGVALGTVSNVLNSPSKVSERTRRKVLASISALGFVRNDAARSLAAGSSTTVGLVVADLGNSLFVDIARGAAQFMRDNGKNVLIADSDIDIDRERRNLEVFEEARVAGILFAPLDTALARSEALPVRSTPVVFVNFASEHLAHAAVVVDERHGGALAARHLMELGRRRLLFAGGPLFLAAIRERWEGARGAVAEVEGAEIRLLDTQGLKIRHGREAARSVLSTGGFDGIVAASDLLAIGIIEVLSQQADVRVPDHIAVTGYDNNHFASESVIPVTTVGQPGDEMGRAAAALLLEQIEHPQTETRTVILEPHLIPRRSTIGETGTGDR